MRSIRPAVLVAALVAAAVALIGCGGGNDDFVGRLALITDIPGNWDLDVFFSSGATTIADYFGDPEVAEVSASFRVDGTFTMLLRDAAGSRIAQIDGTWELPTDGNLILHYPDRDVTYLARYIEEWLYLHTSLNGEEIRLYFK